MTVKKNKTQHHDDYRKMSDFGAWVYSFGGPREVADGMGLKPPAIRRWLRREGSPNRMHLVKLIELSEGRLTLEGLIRDTQPLTR